MERENGQWGDMYADAETVLAELEDAETVVDSKNEAENRTIDIDRHTENLEGFDIFNAELYDLQRTLGHKRLFDDVRREVINVLKGIESPQYRLPEVRKQILDEAVTRAREANPDSKLSKDVMDQYVEDLFDHGTFDLSDEQKDSLSEHLKSGEYWRRSKSDVRMDFESRIAEWIRRGIFEDEITKTK